MWRDTRSRAPPTQRSPASASLGPQPVARNCACALSLTPPPRDHENCACVRLPDPQQLRELRLRLPFPGNRETESVERLRGGRPLGCRVGKAGSGVCAASCLQSAGFSPARMAGLRVAAPPPPAGAMLPSRKKDARGRSGSSRRLSLARPSEQPAGVHARPEWDAGPEAQSCRGAAAVGGPSGSPDWTPFTKKRVGVDRAYPLKPVCHRRARRGNPGAAATSGGRGVSARLPGPGPGPLSQGCGRTRACGRHPRGDSGDSGPVGPGGPEGSHLQRLEAAGRSLAEEIRRGEALLREKLRKTAEGLRRLQERRRAALAGAGGGGGRGRAAHRPGSSPESGSASASEGACGGDGSHRPDSAAPCRPSPSGSRGAQGRPPPSGPARERGPEPPDEPGSARRWRSASESSPSAPPHSSGSRCSPALPELGECGECGHCGRSFLRRRLQRHAAICGRAQATKRKVFDSSRARAKGTELEQYLDWKHPAQAKTELPKSDWRQKHESFIRTLRQAREAQQAIAQSGDPSARPPFLPAENPDYVQCPHCSRHFAPKVAERHIPKCKTIRNRPPPPRKHHA
ncbi:zinc finger C2HC domain-containing protein 1C [Erinaceus europaeus]|uniref:Zinc finger C2HC domain-containing protein 1C n=1 Tax=Erinaceus europaeus TaxID=9365 RepID=A0ABM3WJY7_ERIEU|nr:zinc finger C2HC domain-containing protein 1C [Erinaceus europaeus]